MNKAPLNLQDGFLNQMRKEGVPVVVHLLDGRELRGLVRGFDNFTVMLESEGRTEMVYKHAVSTMHASLPGRPAETQAPSGRPGPEDSTAPER